MDNNEHFDGENDNQGYGFEENQHNEGNEEYGNDSKHNAEGKTERDSASLLHFKAEIHQALVEYHQAEVHQGY